MKENNVEANKSNKLPEGVGKKIVEALRLQSENIEIQDESLQEPEYNFEAETSFDEPQEESVSFDEVLEDEAWDFEEEVVQEAQEEINFEPVNNFDEELSFVEEPVQSQFIQEETFVDEPISQTQFVAQPQPVRTVPFVQSQQNSRSVNSFADLNVDLPPNIAVLKRLISQLPAGVTRQTGAQIIRQTMEAMGISMTKVLSEAQSVQENLVGSVKDKMNTIEEYKNNIKQLENEAQECKKQASQLGDLINLFILSEK